MSVILAIALVNNLLFCSPVHNIGHIPSRCSPVVHHQEEVHHRTRRKGRCSTKIMQTYGGCGTVYSGFYVELSGVMGNVANSKVSGAVYPFFVDGAFGTDNRCWPYSTERREVLLSCWCFVLYSECGLRHFTLVVELQLLV